MSLLIAAEAKHNLMYHHHYTTDKGHPEYSLKHILRQPLECNGCEELRPLEVIGNYLCIQ